MPKGQRTETLTLEVIVDESERIARTQGVDGLTMRAVAAGLGVTPMAIYYYVPGKEDLLRLVVGRVSESFGLLRREEDRSWQEGLRDYLMNIWESFRRYPGLSSYLINQPALGVTPDRLEAGIGFFVDAGFPTDIARLAWSFATTYIHGRISVDAHLGRNTDTHHFEGLRARDHVTFGVDAVIGGLEVMVAGPVLAIPGTAAVAPAR
jgi:AcrR family transcriptional regulator